MDKLNLRFVLLLFTLLLSSIEFISTSPLTESKIDLKTNSTKVKSNLIQIKSTDLNSTHIKTNQIDIILSIAGLNGTTKVKLNHIKPLKTNSTETPTARTFQLLQFNSWLVGTLMGGLQSIFGKTFIPDSHVVFLQTIVNPTFPFTYAGQWWNQNDESQSSSDRIDERIKNDQHDFVLSEILEVLKPKIIDSLTHLSEHPEVLSKIHPSINLTIHPTINLTIHNANAMRPENSAKLNQEIVYDLIDFEEYSKNHTNENYDDLQNLENLENYETYEISYPDLIKNIFIKKHINSTKDEEESVTNLDDVNSSLIDNQTPQTTDRSIIIHVKFDNSNQQMLSGEIKPQFREMQSVSFEEPLNQIEQSNVNRTTDQIKTNEQSNEKLNLADKSDPELVSNQILEQSNDHTDQPETLNKVDPTNGTELNNDKLNSAKSNSSEPILSFVICDNKNECIEEQMEEWDKQIEDEIDYKEPSKELIKKPEKSIKKIFKYLIVKPANYLKNCLTNLKNFISRDTHLILKMFQSFFGFTSTCRHKFLCQLSSFFSLHTPDFIKGHIQRKAENYYINIMEEANRNEFFNALVTGYIGFDCNDFYVNDKRCP